MTDIKRLFCVLLVMIVCNFADAQSLRYLLKYPFKVVESKYEATPAQNGDQQLVYINSDYCPYTIRRDNTNLFIINPGKNIVEYFKKNSALKSPKAESYTYFRGKFPKDFNPNLVYALPVKCGSEVEWVIDPRERSRTFAFKINDRDTVYASRCGIVCKTDYPSGILVKHNDESFAAYLNLSEQLVFPGETVDVGQPIALASYGGSSVSFFFLDENLFNNGKPGGYAYTHFSPVFRTDKGDTKLEEDTKYTCVIDDALIIQEMSKSKQKKYLKGRK